MTSRKRKLTLTMCPDVSEGSAFNRKIQVRTGCWAGQTRYEVTAELDIDDARRLIVRLRHALNLTANSIIKHAQDQISMSNGPLG